MTDPRATCCVSCKESQYMDNCPCHSDPAAKAREIAENLVIKIFHENYKADKTGTQLRHEIISEISAALEAEYKRGLLEATRKCTEIAMKDIESVKEAERIRGLV